MKATREHIYYGLKQLFEEPNQLHYMTVLNQLCSSDVYDPSARVIDDMKATLGRGEFQSIADKMDEVIVSSGLHPEMYIVAALAYEELGNTEMHETVLFELHQVCKGIEASGDGTRDLPLHLSHQSIARIFLEIHLKKEIALQNLQREGGRYLLQVKCKDGSETWFDVSLPRLHPAAQPDRPNNPQGSRTLESTSESGAPIYRYSAPTGKQDFSIGDDTALNGVSEHMEKHIGKVDMVFHELLSPTIHVDIHWIKPTKERNYHTLFTTGMAEKPMNTPPGAEDCKFAELIVCLPPEWELTQESFNNEANYWPIRWMKQLARFVHDYNTWFWYYQTIPNGDPAEPFHSSVKFAGWMFVPPLIGEEALPEAKLPDGREISFLLMMPLHAKEMDYKLAKGSDELLDKLIETGISHVINVARPSAVTAAKTARPQSKPQGPRGTKAPRKAQSKAGCLGMLAVVAGLIAVLSRVI